jgi:hypothetical protein
MEQLSFSQKPEEKVFFLGALSGRSAARTFRRIRPARRPRPNNPVKIRTGDINSGNNKQEN